MLAAEASGASSGHPLTDSILVGSTFRVLTRCLQHTPVDNPVFQPQRSLSVKVAGTCQVKPGAGVVVPTVLQQCDKLAAICLASL